MRHAVSDGIPVEGLCLCPILDYPGWCNNRHRETGLFGYLDAQGTRPVHHPLAEELRWQQAARLIRGNMAFI